MTYYTYRRFSLQYFSTESKDDSLYLDSIKKVSKTIAYRYIGTNAGTPANQLSKRVDNLILKFFGKDPQYEGSGASNVASCNRQFYSNAMNPTSHGPFIAVKLRIGEPQIGSLLSSNPDHHYDSIYADIGDVCRWIIDRFMVAAREEELLQCIMKRQYDVMYDLFGSASEIPEDMRLDIARRYLAMECILVAEPDRIGDVFEIVLDTDSFNVLIPGFTKPMITDNLLIVRKNRVSESDVSPCSPIFRNIGFCNGYIHQCDLELSIYKHRMAMDFGKFNLLIIQDDIPMNIESDVVSILSKIEWLPEHIQRIVDSPGSENPLVEAAVIYSMGIGRGDVSSRSILMSVYRDILSIGFPDAPAFFDELYSEEDNIKSLRRIKHFVTKRRIDDRNLYSILTTALIHSLTESDLSIDE